MKKVVFTLGLCLLAGFSYAQKKNISAAKNELKGDKPNITEARALIVEALANPETVNEAETWYVAGLIENKQFDTERAKEMLGMTINEDEMYPALDRIYPKFQKADSLDQLPDAKGKVKLNFRKDIKSIMFANLPYYVNAGSYFFEKENYQKAYENFRLYGDMGKLPIFQGEESKFGKVSDDTMNIKIRYFAALSAVRMPNHAAAIELFDEIKDYGFEENDIYQNLASELYKVGDTVRFEEVLQKGAAKFPKEAYYIKNLINLYINREQIDESVDYLQKAIEVTPDDPQLYDVLGLVYESAKKNEEAIVAIKKAVEMKPDYQEALSHLGRLHYNLGVEQRGIADNIMDKAEYEKEFNKALDYFKEALPYFQKAYELNPEDSDAIFALRNIYYNLGMNDEYEKMDKIYSGQ